MAAKVALRPLVDYLQQLADRARVRGVMALVIATGALALGGGAWMAPQAEKAQRAPVALREAGTAAALEEGRRWLIRQQQADGGWKLDTAPANDVAATAFGLLPLLSAGEDRDPAGGRFGPYASAVERGLKALAAQQNGDGGFPGGMYAHGLATAALCEGYRRTGDARRKEPAQRAIDYIVKAQHAGGGWRYAPGQPGDTSVTSWQVTALDRGVAAGLNVPKAALDRANAYLDTAAYDGGARYGYIPGAASSKPVMTAAGLNSRLLLGWQPRSAALVKGAALLQQFPPSPALANGYYYYYATRVMHRVGGTEWEFWEPRMAQWLLDRQVTAGAERGSWPTKGDLYGTAGGRMMTTSLALLTLEPCGRLTAPVAPDKLSERQAAANWEDLLSRDVTIVRAAVGRLAAAPAQSVPMLRDQLRPSPAPEPKRVQSLLGNLGSEDFDTRERATMELHEFGAPVLPALRRALKTASSLETRRRLERLIAILEPPGRMRRLRALRAVQVLELAGTAEARRALEAITREQPDTPLAEAARTALERIAR